MVCFDHPRVLELSILHALQILNQRFFVCASASIQFQAQQPLCCEDGPPSGTCCPGVGRPGMPVLGPQLHRNCGEEAGKRSGEDGCFQVGERERP